MSTINIDEWHAELDSLMAETGPKVIPAGGFTQSDLMARYNLKATSAQRRIRALIDAGKVKQIGVRPGQGQEKVYEIASDCPRIDDLSRDR